MLSGIAHQSQIECQIVYRGNLHGQQFLSLKQVVQVSLGVYAVDFAAIRIDRREIVLPLLVAHVHRAFVGKEHGVSAVTGWHHAVEHIHAALNAFENVLRCTNAHQVTWARLGQNLIYHLNHLVHHLSRLAYGQTADRGTTAIVKLAQHVANMLGCILAQVLIGTTLNDREQRLVVAVQGLGLVESLNAALQPSLSEAQAVLGIFVVALAWRALVERHHDIGANHTLGVHHVLRRKDMLRTINMTAELATFLTANKGKYYGRFNQGAVSINLPDVALSCGKDEGLFWKTLDDRLELCHKALQIRHKRLSKITSDVAPTLWQYGALARLDKGESIHELLHHGYSTISLGYAGLYECVKYMTGHSHTDNGKGKEFGLEVMQHMNDMCKKWKEEENIDYSVYGTPIESTTYKFAKCLRERFGVIKGITDRDYITNSYHVPVFEEIDAFTKLKLESEFQRLSPGGAISYIETPNLENNLDAVLEIIDFIYNNIMYAELNTKSDYCHECGYTGEILIDDNLEWYCPNCGNRDHDKMNVARRTCGYIGANFWNKGRTQEIKERVLHIDNKAA